MTNKKGGYQIVDVATLTYEQAVELLKIKKPLLVVDGKNEPYFADSFVLNDDNEVVIQKGGQTITIEEDETITIDGDIAVSGGGGSSSLYLHHLINSNEQLEFFIVSTTSDAFIGNEDGEYMITNGKFYNIISACKFDKSTFSYTSIDVVGGTSLINAYYTGNSTSLTQIGVNYTDNVTEL